MEEGLQVETERGAAVEAGVARGRQAVVAELQRWYKVGPFRRLPGTSLVCNVVLPDSGHYEGVEPAALTAAVAHVLTLTGVLAQVLGVYIPVRWRLCGALSAIWRAGDAASAASAHSLFFEAPTARVPALDLVDAAVCALCASQGIHVAPADTHRLLPNLTALLTRLLAPTARLWLCEFRCPASAPAVRRVLSTVTPVPSSPLFTDVVSNGGDEEEEENGCTVRIAAIDRDVVCAARSVVWTNLRPAAPPTTGEKKEEEPRAVEMFEETHRLTAAGGVADATVAAEAAAAFRACVAQEGVVRGGVARPLMRCGAADGVPVVACVAGSETAVRTIAAQLRTRLHQYIAGSGVTTATPSPCVRARARSVPTQNPRKQFDGGGGEDDNDDE